MPKMCEKLWQSEYYCFRKYLYNRNVLMICLFYFRALGVPTSEYSFEDVIVMTRARDLRIPLSGDIVEIERTLDKLK